MTCHFHFDSLFLAVASSTLFLLAIQLQLSSVNPFQPIRIQIHHHRSRIQNRAHIITVASRTNHDYPKYSSSLLLPLMSKKGKGDGDDGDDRTGMKGAFESLDSFSSLDIGDDLKDDATTGKTAKATSSIKADDDLLKAISSDDMSSPSSSNDEVKLYSEIYKELETDGGDGVYENIMGEMTGDSLTSSSTSSSTSATKGSVIKDADGIGSLVQDDEMLTAVEISQDTDEMMKRALEEAMEEVTSKAANDNSNGNGSTDSDSKLADSILNDKEMMKEINAIFDKANEKLLDSIAEIKDEQAALTQASAKSRSDSLKNEEQRLAEAQGSVVRLVDKVKEETAEVEKAVEDLKKAQQELMNDPLMKAADLKSGGIVKQGALVGALLFSFRSFGELLLLAGPNGADHGVAAAIQAVIALACAAYFIFV